RALDWAYVPVDVSPAGLGEAVGGLAALGFAGANVTVPHKEAVVAYCDEAEGDAVNTLVLRDGRVLGFNTDTEIVAGVEATRVCLIGAGGAAKALLPALAGEVRVFSRSGDWPPNASDCDLVVNATRSTPTSRAASRGTAGVRASSSSRTKSRCSRACGTGARSGRRSRSSSAIATTRTGRGA